MMDIFDFYEGLGKSKFEKKSFSQVQKEIGGLPEHSIVFESLHRSSLFEEHSVHISSDDLMHFRLMILEISDKQDLIEKLHGLSNEVASLRSAIALKDQKKTRSVINTITKDKYLGILALIRDLNVLKLQIDKMENLHNYILDSELSIDVKAGLEEEFSKKHKDLQKIHVSQKNIFLNLSHQFLELTREHVLK